MADSSLPEMPVPHYEDPRPFVTPDDDPRTLLAVPLPDTKFKGPPHARLPSDDPDRNRRLSRVIEAADQGAKLLWVFNRDTGEVINYVQRICVGEGWLDRFVQDEEGLFLWDPDAEELVLERLYGPWALKPRSYADPILGQAVTPAAE